MNESASLTYRLVNKIHNWTQVWLKRKPLQEPDVSETNWENLVLIYQPGKVGSTTYYESVKRVWEGQVIKTHSFQDRPDHTPSMHALVTLNKTGRLPKVNIITGIREPVGRNLSAFFQNLHKFHAIVFDDPPFSTKELWDLTMRSRKPFRLLNWFDVELNEYFGIDVYKKKLKSEGYQIYENENARVLLLKHDIPDNRKSELIGEFLGLTDFVLTSRENIGSTKWYAAEYESFKSDGLPKWYVDEMLDSKYAKHFYANQREALKNKWTRDGQD